MRVHRISNDKDYLPGGIAMEANDGTGAFHYNATMDSAVSPHTNGLPVSAQASQMIHQGYDTASSQQIADESSEMYSNTPKRNDQIQDNLYDLSNNQTVQNNFITNTMETAEMYQQQGDARNNEEYTANDSNVETYMMEHDPNQYDEYDPSQYQGQYINGNQFNVMAEQTENNQTISNVARTSTETLH